MMESGNKLISQAKTLDPFDAFNKSQVFNMQAAAKSFMEFLIIDNLSQLLNSLPTEFASLKPVLQVFLEQVTVIIFSS